MVNGRLVRIILIWGMLSLCRVYAFVSPVTHIVSYRSLASWIKSLHITSDKLNYERNLLWSLHKIYQCQSDLRCDNYFNFLEATLCQIHPAKSVSWWYYRDGHRNDDLMLTRISKFSLMASLARELFETVRKRELARMGGAYAMNRDICTCCKRYAIRLFMDTGTVGVQEFDIRDQRIELSIPIHALSETFVHLQKQFPFLHGDITDSNVELVDKLIKQTALSQALPIELVMDQLVQDDHKKIREDSRVTRGQLVTYYNYQTIFESFGVSGSHLHETFNNCNGAMITRGVPLDTLKHMLLDAYIQALCDVRFSDLSYATASINVIFNFSAGVVVASQSHGIESHPLVILHRKRCPMRDNG